jgi:multiple sugar transport system permease protein
VSETPRAPALQRAPARGRVGKRTRRIAWLAPALLMLPGAALFAVVVLSSAVQSLWISLHDWDGFGGMRWVGLGNYAELWRDPAFRVSLRNNLVWFGMFMLAPPLGLALALATSQPIAGFRTMRSLFYLPLVLSSVTVGVIFSWIYVPDYGLLAQIWELWGGVAPAPLSSERWVTPAIALAALWPQVAFAMVLYMAGLTTLDAEQIGAARIEGARGWSLLWHVVLPQLRPVTLVAFAIAALGSLNSFDMVSVMTKGGPYGSSSVLAWQMFEQSISSYRMGYGAAIATVILLLSSAFITLYVRRMVRP